MLIFNNERLYMIDHYVDSNVSIITWRVIMLIFNNERLYMIDHYVDFGCTRFYYYMKSNYVDFRQ
jgi:hypothetical protein